MFNLWEAGASEIYLDGKLLNKSGKVGSSKENEILFEERTPGLLFFQKIQSI